MSWRGLYVSTAVVLALHAPVFAADELETRATAIVSAKCLTCHNPDQKIAGLVLTNREYAVASLRRNAGE